MGPFIILIIIVVVILIIWWALLRNVKNYKPDFDVHHDEGHAETAHGETGFGHLDASERHLAEQTAETPAAVAVAPAPVTTTDYTAVFDPPATRVEAIPVEPAAEAAPAMPDDLTILEGVGPKINQILHENGIHSFAQLAAADVNSLRQILEANALRFIDPGTWPEQARLAAAGRMDDLKVYTDTLRGGRSVN